jgi:hypothetical protein
MLTQLIRKILFAIAGMSRKASVWYCWILTFFFCLAVSTLLTGVIFIRPDETPGFAIPLTIVGAVFLFLVTATITLTTLASNYVRKKTQGQNPKDNQPK